MEGGTIPERGYFDLRLKESGAKIGELDEEFVWERRIGDTFALGAQVWQITEITHNAVEVVPARRAQQIIPFWRAEELDRDFYYSEKIASFLEICNDRAGEGQLHPGDARRLLHGRKRRGGARPLPAKAEGGDAGPTFPTGTICSSSIIHDPLGRSDAQQVILHTLWGNSVNRPFTFALAAAWEKKYGYPLQAFYNNDGIALLLPHEFDVAPPLLSGDAGEHRVAAARVAGEDRILRRPVQGECGAGAPPVENELQEENAALAEPPALPEAARLRRQVRGLSRF